MKIKPKKHSSNKLPKGVVIGASIAGTGITGYGIYRGVRGIAKTKARAALERGTNLVDGNTEFVPKLKCEDFYTIYEIGRTPIKFFSENMDSYDYYYIHRAFVNTNPLFVIQEFENEHVFSAILHLFKKFYKTRITHRLIDAYMCNKNKYYIVLDKVYLNLENFVVNNKYKKDNKYFLKKEISKNIIISIKSISKEIFPEKYFISWKNIANGLPNPYENPNNYESTFKLVFFESSTIPLFEYSIEAEYVNLFRTIVVPLMVLATKGFKASDKPWERSVTSEFHEGYFKTDEQIAAAFDLVLKKIDDYNKD